jgi:uncharacterized protein involved in exopolysaccharide biosynthesis
MRSHLISSSDLQTGLIRFAVTHRDSAVARRVLIRLIDEVNNAYLGASHSQAKAIAAAQANRVDSAAARLSRAESNLLEFTRGNRITLPYSEASLSRTRLERERDFAQTLYAQAVTERDAAIGRALEETPALIVVDPVPAKLKPASRGLSTKLPLTLLVVVALSVLVVLIRLKLQVMAVSGSDADRRIAEILLRRPERGRAAPQGPRPMNG